MGIKIVVASPTGLCFGVKRAIAQMEKALAAGKQVYCIGSPIHNPQEVGRLTAQGLQVVACPEDVPLGSTVFVRAHGMAPQLWQRLEGRGARVIDGTCPFVRVAQRRAMELDAEGYTVVVAGDASHPEVESIVGGVEGRALVVSTSTDMERVATRERIGILSQTTLPEKTFSAIVAVAVQSAREVKAFNTICRATSERQIAIADLASRVDGVVIIGGRNSANTGKLYQIARDCGSDVAWIEEANELSSDWLQGKGTIGLAAGASTPDWLIEQFISAVHRAADVKGDVSYE